MGHNKRISNYLCSNCGAKGGNGKVVRIIDVRPPTDGVYPTTLYCIRCHVSWESSQQEGYDGYLSTPSGYKQASHWLWEATYGPIPQGSIIHHLNGIHTDNQLDNLVCISHQEHDLSHRNTGKKQVIFYRLTDALREKVRELEAQLAKEKEGV